MAAFGDYYDSTCTTDIVFRHDSASTNFVELFQPTRQHVVISVLKKELQRQASRDACAALYWRAMIMPMPVLPARKREIFQIRTALSARQRAQEKRKGWMKTL